MLAVGSLALCFCNIGNILVEAGADSCQMNGQKVWAELQTCDFLCSAHFPQVRICIRLCSFVVGIECQRRFNDLFP